MVKNPPAMQEKQVQSLGWEDPLEEEIQFILCISYQPLLFSVSWYMSWLILNVGDQYSDEYSIGFPGGSDDTEYTYT